MHEARRADLRVPAVVAPHRQGSLHRGLGLTLEEGLRLENTLWNTNLSLPDTLDGPKAFIAKRKFVPTQEV